MPVTGEAPAEDPGRRGPGAGVDAGEAASAAPDRRRRWRRVLVSLATVLSVMLVVAGVLSWRWFVRPTVDGPIRADAIVMFGGTGARFERAVALAEADWADVVVISDPVDEEAGDSRYEWFCRNDGSRAGYPVHDYETHCFEPETLTTRGEARYVADLAKERGWQRINLVTTVDQATRARMLLDRCWDGEIASVTVPTDESRLGRIFYEWAAMARALFQRRGC